MISQCDYLYFNSSLSQWKSYLAIDDEKKSTTTMTMRSEMIDWLDTERLKITRCLYWLECDKGMDTENANNFLMILANMNSISEMFNPIVFNFTAFRSSGKSIVASLFSDRDFVDTSAELMNVGPGESALTVSNMQTWISAAMTDQDTCLEGLDEMGSPLLGEVKARVQNAKEYMSNTLAILSNMPSLLQKFGITMH
ncbi:hypothetical protein RND71_029829 [Anisodus tanguticus]|uniref:Pectinesterase inhibitor domain-containing protein n=1 Tax=Anisodus tanguticus TaxID=243964 RepID=A0AAE1V4X7_9SOLA|nr:hypothetical protein RND71_029829 [Anisodus tanguticus]